MNNAELSVDQEQLIQSLEKFIRSTDQQVKQLEVKVASAKKLLDELRKQS